MLGWFFGVKSNDYYEADGQSSIKPSENAYDKIQLITDYPTQNHTLIVNNRTELFHEDYSTIGSQADMLVKSNALKEIYIFRINIESNYTSIINATLKAKMKYYKITINDELVRNFIPCYRKSDNVRGFFDLVEQRFYINQGTGTFGIGDVAQVSDNLKYFDSETIARDLGIDDLDDEIIVNFDTREVYSLNGVKYNGQKHYTQYGLPGGQIIEQKTDQVRDLTEVSLEDCIEVATNGLNARITFSNLPISNGTLSYTATYGDTNSKTSNEIINNYTRTDADCYLDINKSGTYVFKLTDNNKKSNYCETSDGIEIKLINPPTINGDLDMISTEYDYSNLDASENWAYAQDTGTNNYYVWIPRFAYQTSTPTNIEFLKGSSDLTTSGGYIPMSGWTIPNVFNDKIGVWVQVSSSEQTGFDIISDLENGTIY